MCCDLKKMFMLFKTGSRSEAEEERIPPERCQFEHLELNRIFGLGQCQYKSSRVCDFKGAVSKWKQFNNSFSDFFPLNYTNTPSKDKSVNLNMQKGMNCIQK